MAYMRAQAPVAQLDRALPSEGRGHRFESCRVRHVLSHGARRLRWGGLTGRGAVAPLGGKGSRSFFSGAPTDIFKDSGLPMAGIRGYWVSAVVFCSWPQSLGLAGWKRIYGLLPMPGLFSWRRNKLRFFAGREGQKPRGKSGSSCNCPTSFNSLSVV
jgi:hypothetical protein